MQDRHRHLSRRVADTQTLAVLALLVLLALFALLVLLTLLVLLLVLFLSCSLPLSSRSQRGWGRG